MAESADPARAGMVLPKEPGLSRGVDTGAVHAEAVDDQAALGPVTRPMTVHPPEQQQPPEPAPSAQDAVAEPVAEPFAGPFAEPVGGPPPAPAPRRRRRVAAWAGATGVLAAGLYVGAAWALSSSAPRGTAVAGVSIGGKDHAGIVAALTSALQRQKGTLAVALGTRTAELDLAASGLTVDPQATADRLTGFSPGSLSPATVWRHVAGGGAQEVAPAEGSPAGKGQLEGSLRSLTDQLSLAPVDATVRFATAGGTSAGGTVTTVAEPGADGTVLNIAEAAERIQASWLGGPRPVQLPVQVRAPQVTRADAEQAVKELAQPAISGPLTLTVGQVTVTVQPSGFAPALAISPSSAGSLELTVDGEKLSAAVLAASPKIGKAPQDARIELRNGTPHIVPGVEGVTLDPKKVGPAVLPALTSDRRTAIVPTTTQQPRFTTKDAEKLGVTQKVSTFSTILTTNRLRTENLRVAARTVNGTLVLPGETFSLNGTLGERTAAKGYHQAPAINSGRLVQDYGGGVSQMATTIFNNVFFAGLQDLHHKPHSFYISRYPEGREATVNYPTVDLTWRNDSPYGVLIQANVTKTVNVSFWSTKVWDITASKSGRSHPRTPVTVYDDKPGCVSQDANPGFDVSVTRTFSKAGKAVRRETFHTTYIAEDRVVCGPKPKS